MPVDPAARLLRFPKADTVWDWVPQAAGRTGPQDARQECCPGPPRLDRSTVDRRSALALPIGPPSSSTARDFTRTTLHQWALDDLVDDVAMTASELASNALRYGQDPCAAYTSPPTLWLGTWAQHSHVLCAVSDSSDHAPQVKQPDCLAESGRGLHVIAGLSDAWGWTRRTGGGKVVWARFHNCPLRSAS
ncbi:ATP-binding protein [Streptacidiphilus sp. EB103A]|uniref:ATP-binding protein n=1 Tax=Streptacidiphilus sp. EB103A TaxID=3156275 RepID=UPI0035128F3F